MHWTLLTSQMLGVMTREALSYATCVYCQVLQVQIT